MPNKAWNSKPPKHVRTAAKANAAGGDATAALVIAVVVGVLFLGAVVGFELVAVLAVLFFAARVWSLR